MKVRVLAGGSHAGITYEPGAELEGDSDHMRELLVNGLAEPLDESAQGFMARTQDHEPYVKASYQAVKAELDSQPAPELPTE